MGPRVDRVLPRAAGRGRRRHTFPFDVGWREYRRHAFYPYIAWIFTIGRAAYHPHWQPDEYSRAIIERTGQAIVDHDAFNALASSLAS